MTPDVHPGDPEFGVRCPKCRAQVVMVNPSVVECANPYCDVAVLR